MGAILNDGCDPKSPHELAAHMPTPESLLHRRSSKSSSSLGGGEENAIASTGGENAVSAYRSRHRYAGDYRLPYAPEFFRSYPHLREFFCGGTAAAINIVITFPPNKIMFRQQVGLLFMKMCMAVMCVKWLIMWLSFVCSSLD